MKLCTFWNKEHSGKYVCMFVNSSICQLNVYLVFCIFNDIDNAFALFDVLHPPSTIHHFPYSNKFVRRRKALDLFLFFFSVFVSSLLFIFRLFIPFIAHSFSSCNSVVFFLSSCLGFHLKLLSPSK